MGGEINTAVDIEVFAERLVKAMVVVPDNIKFVVEISEGMFKELTERFVGHCITPEMKMDLTYTSQVGIKFKLERKR